MESKILAVIMSKWCKEKVGEYPTVFKTLCPSFYPTIQGPTSVFVYRILVRLGLDNKMSNREIFEVLQSGPHQFLLTRFAQGFLDRVIPKRQITKLNNEEE